MVTLVGGLILDQSSETPVQFQSIGSIEAEKMGITPDQWNAYQSELEELNAVAENANKLIKGNEKISAQEAALVWKNEMSILNPSTQTAVQKMIQSVR